MFKRIICMLLALILVITTVISSMALEDNTNAGFQISSLQKGNNGFVALDSKGDTYYSKNPYSLIKMENQGKSVSRVVYGNKEFVAFSDEILMYSDGSAKWYEFSSEVTKRKINDMIFSSTGYFVGCGKDSLIFSNDGVNWSEREVFGYDFYNVAEVIGGYVLFGKSNSGEYVTVHIQLDGTFNIAGMKKSAVQEKFKKTLYYKGALYCATESGSVVRFVPQLYVNANVDKLSLLGNNCKDMGIFTTASGDKKLVFLNNNGDILVTEDGLSFNVMSFGNKMNLLSFSENVLDSDLFRVIVSDDAGMRYFETKDLISWKISRDIEYNDGKNPTWFLNESYFSNTMEVVPNVSMANISDSEETLNNSVNINTSVAGSVYNSVYASVYNANKEQGVLVPSVNSNDTASGINSDSEIKTGNDTVTESVYKNTDVEKDVIIKLIIGSSKMIVNDIEKGIDNDATVMPVINNGRTLVPLRAIMEELGGGVEWLPETEELNITFRTTDINLAINDKTAYINGVQTTLDVPPQIISGRTFMPLRFIMESLKLSVVWEKDTNSIVISTKK